MRSVTTYYDLGSANERIAELRPLLIGLRDDRDAIAGIQKDLERLRDSDGDADPRAELEARREEITRIVHRMEATVRRIDAWGVTLRDIGSGLVDVPALANGRPIWLCWKLGEEEIGWWHELDAGLAGRTPLIDLE